MAERGRGMPYASKSSSQSAGRRKPSAEAASRFRRAPLRSSEGICVFGFSARGERVFSRIKESTEAVCSGNGNDGIPAFSIAARPPSPIEGPKKQLVTGSPDALRTGIIASATGPVSTPVGGTITTTNASYRLLSTIAFAAAA